MTVALVRILAMALDSLLFLRALASSTFLEGRVL